MPPRKPRWIDYLPIETIEPALANAKRHVLEQIAESYERFGYVEPITMDDRTERLVAGHGRLASLILAHKEGGTPPDGIMVKAGAWLAPVTRGWASANDYEARAYLIASNKLTEAGGWDRAELIPELDELAASSDYGLAGLGIGMEELDELRQEHEDARGQADADAEKGSLLALADVSIGEPTHQPEDGDVWTVGRHVLVVARLKDGHALWRDLLVDGVLFAPYPDPYITAAMTDDQRLVCVQPDLYLAGHLLDKHASLFPDDEVVKR